MQRHTYTIRHTQSIIMPKQIKGTYTEQIKWCIDSRHNVAKNAGIIKCWLVFMCFHALH